MTNTWPAMTSFSRDFEKRLNFTPKINDNNNKFLISFLSVWQIILKVPWLTSRHFWSLRRSTSPRERSRRLPCTSWPQPGCDSSPGRSKRPSFRSWEPASTGTTHSCFQRVTWRLSAANRFVRHCAGFFPFHFVWWTKFVICFSGGNLPMAGYQLCAGQVFPRPGHRSQADCSSK